MAGDPETMQKHSGGHERGDVPAGPVAKFGVALIVLMLVALGLLAWWLPRLASTPTAGVPQPSPMVQQGQLPPLPRLQVTPPRDLGVLRKTEDALIHRYEWIDRDAGQVRIPVDRAIEIISRKGLPARATSAQTQDRPAEGKP